MDIETPSCAHVPSKKETVHTDQLQQSAVVLIFI